MILDHRGKEISHEPDNQGAVKRYAAALMLDIMREAYTPHFIGLALSVKSIAWSVASWATRKDLYAADPDMREYPITVTAGRDLHEPQNASASARSS